MAGERSGNVHPPGMARRCRQRASSAMTRFRPSCHVGSAMPKSCCSLRLSSTDHAGRLAGVGYSELGMASTDGTLASTPVASASAKIASAKPCQLVCPNAPCGFNGKLQLNFNTAKKLDRKSLLIAKFKGSTGEETHQFTLKVPKKIRKAARKAHIRALKVRTTVVTSDSAGSGTRTRGTVKVGV